jgi:hypothetical protein
MSKTVMVFFTLILILASCSIAGCSSLPFSGTPAPTETPKKVGVGLTGEKNPETARRLVFEDTAEELASVDLEAIKNYVAANASSQKKHIKYVRGADLDENGDAGSWTFIVEYGDQFSIVSYSTKGMVFSSSPGTVKRTEIFIDQIMTPRRLFEKNRAVILNTTRTGAAVSRDLSLGGGDYTLTISGKGTSRILVFDATTGALTSLND